MSDKTPRFPGIDWHEGEFHKSSSMARGAKSYAKAANMPYSTRGVSSVRADPDVLMRVGNIVRDQSDSPTNMTPELSRSYESLKDHVGRQFDHLTRPTTKGGMGIKVEVTKEDPYPNPRAMRDDVETNKRLKVLSTESTGGMSPGHPLDNAANDKLRAVHDAFGHLATGRDFSRHGEAGAFHHHLQMLPPEAHAAAASELRAQTAHLIAHNDFPANKPYNLPDWATRRKAVEPSAPTQPKQSKQGKLFR